MRFNREVVVGREWIKVDLLYPLNQVSDQNGFIRQACIKRVIDDADPVIQYSPTGWFTVGSESISLGNFGRIYQETSPRFKFKLESQFPLQCAIERQKFYLDYILYTPLPDASFETAVLLYTPTDPAVSFGPGWSDSTNSSNSSDGEKTTNHHGAQVSLTFHGTSVLPYGSFSADFPHNATWATYSIDHNNPVNFTLPGLDANSTTTLFKEVLFTMPTLPSGNHTLIITHGGDSQHTALVLEWFYVTNTSTTTISSNSTASSSSPFSSSSLFSSSSSSPLPSPVSTSPPSQHSASVGGVAGAAFLWRRRNRATADLTNRRTPYLMSDTVTAMSATPSTPRKRQLLTHRGRERSALVSRPIAVVEEERRPPVLQHQDSGMRLPALSVQSETRVFEIPPGYSVE
ncbi:hypothetical protein R3P38DRAFT_3367466 [Favolaschia claudopus]|uniref:Uncharacterized protein n=1 Tax=Favolaschia claudopus TaxID=2862362 RepID=A0AAW0A7X0_9AGAR